MHWQKIAIPLSFCLFFCRELIISNGLSRHFSWSKNILFVEDLLNNKLCCKQYRQLLPTSIDAMQEICGVCEAPARAEGNSSSVSLPENNWKTHRATHNKIEHTVCCITFHNCFFV
jgi:hypothetical protein